MSKFLLPVPNHTIGDNLITVQYDSEMIPYLIGLLNASGRDWAFDKSTGDILDGESYIDTLITQLLTEVEGGGMPIIVLYPDLFTSSYGPRLLSPMNWSPASGVQNLYYQSSSPSASDNYYYNLVLPAGDYIARIRYSTGGNAGIYEYGFDGYTPLEIDHYNTSALVDSVDGLDSTALPAGNHVFRIKCTGKNASSGDYYTIIQPIVIQRIG